MTRAAEVVRAATLAGVTIAAAESLTGGSVTDALVGVPGASACLRGGVVAYATEVKQTVLGVDAALLGRHGAVHPDVAAQMAAGVRRVLGADFGVATTGVAGPDPQDGCRPGTVHVAVCGPTRTVVRSAEGTGHVAGDRAAVRRWARDAALLLLLDEVRAAAAEGLRP
ncbi:MAG: nicotinamide-nucleotide amidohydrolase family protein [Actinotalea sp.]|nr:nicotinamide-nucleotide amidohydrolase family protein [Actinotalea sp.]